MEKKSVEISRLRLDFFVFRSYFLIPSARRRISNWYSLICPRSPPSSVVTLQRHQTRILIDRLNLFASPELIEFSFRSDREKRRAACEANVRNLNSICPLSLSFLGQKTETVFGKWCRPSAAALHRRSRTRFVCCLPKKRTEMEKRHRIPFGGRKKWLLIGRNMSKRRNCPLSRGRPP